MSFSSSVIGGRIKYKIVLLGDSQVGKTAIIQRFINNRFDEKYNATVGIDFLIKNLTYKGRQYRLQLWDTAGQQRFRSLITHYTKDSNICLLVYDMNNLKSLQNIERWMELYNSHRQNSAFCIIIGNKKDLQGKICTDNLIQKQLNKYPQTKHFTISAKTGDGVIQLFNQIIQLINFKLGIVLNSNQLQQKSQRNQKQSLQVNTAKTLVVLNPNIMDVGSKQQSQHVKLQPEKKKRCLCC